MENIIKYKFCIPSLNTVAGYVDDLMREAVDLCKKPSADRPVQLEEPPTLSSAMEKPDKAEAIKAHASRFKTK